MIIVLQLISVGLLSILGSVVWLQQPKSKINLSFFLFTIFLSLWIILGIFSNIESNYALILNRLVFVPPLALMWSALTLATLLSGWRSVLPRIVGVVAAVVATVAVFSDFVVGSVMARYAGQALAGYNINRNLGYYLYVICLVAMACITIYVLLVRRRATTKKQRTQMSIVSVGLVFALVVGICTSIVLPVILDTSAPADYSFLAGVVVALFFAYAIVRHSLFDVKLVAVRTVAYGGSLITLSFIYYALAYLITETFFVRSEASTSVSFGPVNIFLALVLAFLFQPIKRFFDKYTDKIFYHNDYSPEVFYTDLSKLLVSTTDLRSLLQRISQLLEDTFKSDQVIFMVYFDKEKTRYMTAGTKVRSDIPKSDATMLDVRMNNNSERIIVTDSLSESDVAIRRMLLSHRVTLTIPIGIDHSISGYLMLGERKSGVYGNKDLKVLDTIVNELAIAIQNVVSIHEVKKLNATLQQRIDVATKELQSSNAQLKRLDSVKDEFMSMASHQLRTPLTSIKGYLSMVLEGDAGQVDARQKKLLLEAFRSSERMVGLIADFLNVSRIQTGRFVLENQYFDLVEMVSEEVDDLSILAESHAIKLRLTVAKSMTAPIYGDENKLRQVIMNFVDNAIYYSKAKSTVVIRITKSTGSVSVRVVDTGIGVPDEEQKRLFNKFFRAKNARRARPDGTGVGLYLARRVVSAHGGQLIFSSKEDKGSTFGFTLPIKEPPAEAEVMPKPVQTTTKLD